VKDCSSPVGTVELVGSTSIVSRTVLFVTVSIAPPEIGPDCAVIWVVPGDTPVATPFEPVTFEIVATELSLDNQLTVAVRSCVDPSEKIPMAVKDCSSPVGTVELVGSTSIAARTGILFNGTFTKLVCVTTLPAASLLMILIWYILPVPLDERVYIEYAGTLYHIPAGYLGGFSPKHEVSTGWFTSKMVGFDMEGINTVKGINLAFWMPSLRYPERDVLSIPEFRFCEDGRPPITPDQPEYTVRIQIRSIDEARKGEYLTPLQSYKNHISRYADGERSFDFQKEYGLIRFKNKTDPDTPDTYLEYRHLENSTPEDTPELRTQQEEARRAIL